MHIHIDTQLARKVSQCDLEERNIFFYDCKEMFKCPKGEDLCVNFNWSSLLAYCGVKDIFSSYPVFQETNPVFIVFANALSEKCSQELVIHVYDQLFIECLTQVQKVLDDQLKEIIHLLQKRHHALLNFSSDPCFFSLNHFKKRFETDLKATVHDLTLYLAWDRMCVALAILFELPFLKNPVPLHVLKECLVESFIHISSEKKTRPGFFCLAQSLFAFYMREENFDFHSEEEWKVLSFASHILQPRELLAYSCYIDATLTLNTEKNAAPLNILTMDERDKTDAGIAFSQLIISKLSCEFLAWPYRFTSFHLARVQENEEGKFVVNQVKKE